MGRIHRPNKVKIFVGLLSGRIELFQKVKVKLGRSFGKIDYESPIMDFAHTNYYKEEMGENLKRQFLSFDRLFDPAGIFKIKLQTNRIEKFFLGDGKRLVNIDPGYLDFSKIILLSTKDYSHRIYLNRGIYAEVTLFYKDKRYNAWPWTYPDYKTEAYIGIFNHLRDLYKTRMSAN